ncbi:MAG: UvrD-helicase domain-containing protein [Caldilineaceae bacterium]
MQLVADLHIHSHYSRATSKDLTFDNLARWAQIKGVHLVGTGDISHPGWLQEMRANLEPAEEGLYRLKPEVAARVEQATPGACRGLMRFVLAGEISNIYKRHGATRKVHNVIFAPSLEIVERIQTALERIGNIRSDGRPILGLDSRDLLEIILGIDERCHLIPAHIWTPWFSMLGSKSGFDSVEECFGDLTPHIFALETGLSSDPPMNWRVSNLDRYTLVSNSDAHSPPKLGREATLLDIEPAYDALFDALRCGDPARCAGTIEFFPEEGKYHLDGHRNCNICWEPPQTIAHHGICPVCGKEITVGVMHRVEVLADRPPGGRPPRTHLYYNLVPLPEVLCEVHNSGPSSRRVTQEYGKLLDRLGPELYILRQAPLEEISAVGGPRLAEAIRRMRSGQVRAEGGYDGEYGVIKLLEGYGQDKAHGAPQIRLLDVDEAATLREQVRPLGQAVSAAQGAGWAQDDLFAVPPAIEESPVTLPQAASGTEAAQDAGASGIVPPVTHTAGEDWLTRLNSEQREAALYTDGPLIIVAGPGTGKTRTLTVRIAHLLQARLASPQTILAITFTNKAAAEMAERLGGLVGAVTAAEVTVKTFHALGAQLLRTYAMEIGLSPDFVILDEADRAALLKRAFPKLGETAVDACLARISACKNQLLASNDPELAGEVLEGGSYVATVYAGYEDALRAAQAVDFDDLISLSVRLLETQAAVLSAVQAAYQWISVDEYQDVNQAQYRLLRLLAAGGANLCVIGDPDQAIYGFRGADRRFFLAFADDYPNAKRLRLTRSYRSPQTLLDAASQMLAADGSDERGSELGAGPEAVKLWSEYTEQVKIDVHPAPTDKAEAEYVVHQIEQMVGGTSYFSLDSGRVDERTAAVTRDFGDFAVLYRLNAQVALLVEAFERSGIPYQVVGQASPYAARPVRELLACLWLLRNPRSRVHLDLLLSAGRSAPSAQYLDELAEIVAQHDYDLAAGFADASSRHTFRAAQRPRLAALARTWGAFAGGESAGPQLVTEVLSRAYGLVAGLQGESISDTPPAWFKALLARAASYGTRRDEFLEATALARAADAYDPRADRVTLSTLHASKGLEFPVVFVVGCEEGLLPYLPAGRHANAEEERRLFYVGMTRAEQRLLLTHARHRFLFGRQTQPAPSPFLADIEQVLKQVHESELKQRRAKTEDAQLRLF